MQALTNILPGGMTKTTVDDAKSPAVVPPGLTWRRPPAYKGCVRGAPDRGPRTGRDVIS